MGECFSWPRKRQALVRNTLEGPYNFGQILKKIRILREQEVPFSDQGTFTPVGAQGGSMEPPEKTTFPPEFCNEICTIYVRVIQNHNSAQKI